MKGICCCCSVTKSCVTLCNPMACSTPGFPVLHCLLMFAQTHVHWVSDAIQPSHSLLPPSPPVLSLSWNQGLFQWVSSLHHFFFYFAVLLMVHWNSRASSNLSVRASASASVLPNIWGWFPLGLTGLIFLLSKGLSRVFSNTTIWNYQFFGAQPFFRIQLSHPYMTTGKTIALTRWTLLAK